MLELFSMLLLGAAGGGIIGWVIGNQMGIGPSAEPNETANSAAEEQRQLEAVARQIRALTLSVAADVSAHQTRVAGITTELQESEPAQHSESIVSAVADLVAANQAMQSRLSESQKQIREQSKQLQTTQQLANTDALTGLANRRVLDSKIAEITAGDNPKWNPVIALVDIDFFKSFNDTFGHATGDTVLSQVAELIEARLGGQGTCARYGGEEFAVVSDTTTWHKIAEALDAARDELSRVRIIPSDPTRCITFSSGIAERLDQESSEAWLERADRALYAAKRNGRNCVYSCQGDAVKRFTPLRPEEDPARIRRAKQREALVDQLRSLADNIDLTQVSLAAVAVRLPTTELDATQRETLLRDSRALFRGIDRIDFADERTLLAMMVTCDTNNTTERANKLLDLVNRTLKMLDMDTTARATIGISLLDDGLSAEDVIRQATERADQACMAAV